MHDVYGVHSYACTDTTLLIWVKTNAKQQCCMSIIVTVYTHHKKLHNTLIAPYANTDVFGVKVLTRRIKQPLPVGGRDNRASC